LINLRDDASRIRSRNFQKYVKRCKTIITWWKRKFNYSSSDPRYLNATLTQMLEDALEEQAIRYIADYESLDPETNKFLKKRELDPKENDREKERIAESLNKFLE